MILSRIRHAVSHQNLLVECLSYHERYGLHKCTQSYDNINHSKKCTLLESELHQGRAT